MTFQIPRITQPFDTSISLPGSKSIALRQIAIAALTDGITCLQGIPQCDDADAMLECVQRLGAQVESTDGAKSDQSSDSIIIRGPIDLHRDVRLDARMSGASTRLLIGLAALRNGTTHIDGHPSLQRRTNAPLLDLLRRCGCQVEGDGGLPVTIRGPLQTQTRLEIDGSLSSQYITALLIIAPWMQQDGPVQISISGALVSRPYLDITRNEMQKRGITASWRDARTLVVEPGVYAGGTVVIEGDATAASYFAGLATIHGGRVTLDNLGRTTHQGDYAFVDVMEALGASIASDADTTTITGPHHLQSLEQVDMVSMPDAALTLIAMAPVIPGDTVISGLSTLHHKECDRLVCSHAELKRIGVQAKVGEEQISVPYTAVDDLNPSVLSTYHDHRMAMAFSLPGSLTGTLTVDDPRVVDKTYPDFWRDFNRLI